VINSPRCQMFLPPLPTPCATATRWNASWAAAAGVVLQHNEAGFGLRSHRSSYFQLVQVIEQHKGGIALENSLRNP